MKYVMFTNLLTGIKAPVICADLFAHADMRCANSNQWIATSAGFFVIEDGRVKTIMNSESLKLSPAKGDGLVLEFVLANMESMLIVSQDLDLNKKLAAKKLCKK